MKPSMKFIIFFCFIVFITFVSASATIASRSNDLNSGLIAFYHLDGNPDDNSGNENHGIAYGGVHYTSGVMGQAAVFNGSNSYIDIPASDNFVFNTGATISLWMYLVRDGKEQNAIYFRDEGQRNNPLMVVKINDAVVYDRLSFRGTLDHSRVMERDILPEGRWTHIVMTLTRNPGEDKTTLFVDGNEVSSSTSQDIGVLDFRNLDHSNSGVNIGRSPANADYLEGVLDEIRIYNRALSETEVNNLYEWEKPYIFPIPFGPTAELPEIAVHNKFGNLMIYPEGSSFDTSLPTIVISHGWNPGNQDDDFDEDGVTGDMDGDDFDPNYTARIPSWQVKMAHDINSVEDVNILLWEWQEEAMTNRTDLIIDPNSYDKFSLLWNYASNIGQGLFGVPFTKVEDSGKYLAYAMADLIPSGYDQKIHLIGHSLGSGVIIFATKRIFNISQSLDNKNISHLKENIDHLTLLDSPWPPHTSPGGLFLLNNKESLFIDNYWSIFGKPLGYHEADANIFVCEFPGLLNQTSYYHYFECVDLPNDTHSCDKSHFFMNFFKPHSYSHVWYRSSISNFQNISTIIDCDNYSNCSGAPGTIQPYGFWWHNHRTPCSYIHKYENDPWDLEPFSQYVIEKTTSTVKTIIDLHEDVYKAILDLSIATGKITTILVARTFELTQDAIETTVNTVGNAEIYAATSLIDKFLSMKINITSATTNPISRTGSSTPTIVTTKINVPLESNVFTFQFRFPLIEPGNIVEIFLGDTLIESLDGDEYIGSGWQSVGWLTVPDNLRGLETDVSFRLSNLDFSTPGQVDIDNLIFANVMSNTDSDGDGHLDEIEIANGVDPFNTPPILVSKECVGGENIECFDNISQGCSASKNIGTVMISNESFDENLSFSQNKQLILSGGWDADFINQNTSTTIGGCLTVSSGSVVLKNITLK